MNYWPVKFQVLKRAVKLKVVSEISVSPLHPFLKANKQLFLSQTS